MYKLDERYTGNITIVFSKFQTRSLAFFKLNNIILLSIGGDLWIR